MGIADIFFPTFAHRVAQCIPDHGSSDGGWSARRAFLGLMGLVRSNRRESLASMLQRQWDLGLFPDFARPPSISGFSQARHLLRVEDCQAAWMLARDHAAGQIPHPGDGRRWIAMDGSWLVTSRSRSSVKRWTVPSGSALPQAIVVTAWEVRNRMPVGFCVLSGSQGERASMDELLPHLRLGDVAMVDRGFPCERLFGRFIAQGVDILARMTAGASAWAETSAFLASAETDLVLPVEVVDPDGTRRRVPMRFIRRIFPVGRPKKGQSRDAMVLVTTLLDAAEHSAESLINRYQQRWAVETAYREMKITFAIEHFHSPDAGRIVEELYALMTWLCLAAGMEAQVNALLEAKRGPNSSEDPQRWMVNRTNLHHFTDQAFWASASPGSWALHQKHYQAHCDTLVRYAQRRRPGRSTPRERLAPFGHFVRGS